jgi:magnesium-transporting ATPase (P-type)
MSEDKRISKQSYQWGHFGVIIAEALVFSGIGYLAWKTNYLIKHSNGNVLQKSKINRNLTIIFWISVIFLIITFLSLIPVFKDYNRIIIE